MDKTQIREIGVYWVLRVIPVACFHGWEHALWTGEYWGFKDGVKLEDKDLHYISEEPIKEAWANLSILKK